MKRPRALKRLGSIALVTGVAAAMMPFIGVTAASATAGGITLVDPCNSAGCHNPGTTISTFPNGTDSLVHLLAYVTQATGSDPRLVTAVFQAHDNTADPTNSQPATTIATAPIKTLTAGTTPEGYDSFATASWSNPVAGDAYTITVSAVDANNATVVGTNSATEAASNTAHDVRLTRPSNDGLVGYYPFTGKYNFSGTASSSSDTVGASDDNNGFANAAVFQGTSQKWATDVPPESAIDTPSAGHNVSLSLPEADNASGAIIVTTAEPGTGYVQTLNSSNGFAFSSPSTQFATAGADSASTRKTYVLQSNDQNGNPISGMPFTLTLTDPNGDNSYKFDTVNTSGAPVYTNQASTSGTAMNETTNQFGQFTFSVSDSENESIAIQAKSEYNGASFNPAVDFTVNGTFTTAVQTATSGTATLSGHPTAPIYPTQTYGDATSGPSIQVNLKDSNNQNVPNATVVYQYTRTVAASTKCSSDTNTYPKTTSPTQSAASDANGNITIVPDPDTLCSGAEAGTDAFTIWIEKNGTPGYQAGADTLVGSPTIAFGPESIYFQPCFQIPKYEGGATQNCASQQKAGQNQTLTFVASIFDGTTYQPVTSRKIDVSLSGGTGTAGTAYGFSSTGNSGLVLVNSTSGDVTTDATGTASVTVFDNNTETLTVTASDPTLGSISTDNGTDAVSFQSFQAVLNSISTTGLSDSTGQVSPIPGDSGGGDGAVGAPGQPLLQGFKFLDQSGAALSNQVITLSTTAGFFTDLPSVSGSGLSLGNPGYTKLHFDTAPADGAVVKGDLHSNGQTTTVVTNAAGEGYFALGTLANSGFAANGSVSGIVTAALGTGGITVPLDRNSTLFSTDAQTYPVGALQPGTFKLFGGTADNNARFQPGTTSPGGLAATAKDNAIPVDTPYVFGQQTDAFGNPISEPIHIQSTGPGNLSTTTIYGSYSDINQADLTGHTPVQGTHLAGTYVLGITNPASANPSSGSENLTFDWISNNITWLVNSTTSTVSTNDVAKDNLQTAAFNWYVRDPAGFHYATMFTPGATEPANTPITEQVTVTDNENRPVPKLGLDFIIDGPQGGVITTGNPYTCTGCATKIFTDVSGQGAFTYDSGKVGQYTATVIITDLSGNELGRSVANGAYTGNAPAQVTIKAAHTEVLKGKSDTLKGVAPAGQTVTVYRDGHKIGKVPANAKGHWKLRIKVTQTATYYAKSGSTSSNSITVRAVKK